MFGVPQRREASRLAGGDVEDGTGHGQMKSPSQKPEQGQRKLMTYIAISVAVFLCLLGLQRFLALGGVSVRADAPVCWSVGCCSCRCRDCCCCCRCRSHLPSLARPPLHPPHPAPAPTPPTPQHLRTDTFPDSFRIAVIADLDQGSKREGKQSWYSLYMTGTLRRKGEAYDVTWDAPAEVATAHNEAGRGCELSELVRYNDALYTFDDRSGIMFQVMNPARSDAAEAPYLVPRHIFMEGSGEGGDKGLKIEWATVKDSALVVGSFGKEFTNNKGEISHSNNLWTVLYKADGTAAHVNWKPNYDAMRATLGYSHPAYLLHEAAAWSPHHRKWYVLPRRVSREPYDDVSDEKRGSNLIVMASHDFKEVTSTTVGVSACREGGWGKGAGACARARGLPPGTHTHAHHALSLPLRARPADGHARARLFQRKVPSRLARHGAHCAQERGERGSGHAAHLLYSVRREARLRRQRVARAAGGAAPAH